MTADLLTGMSIGLMIGMIAVFLTSDSWYRDCMKMNERWAVLCRDINDGWAERCAMLMNGENETCEKMVSLSEEKIEKVKESSEGNGDAGMQQKNNSVKYSERR